MRLMGASTANRRLPTHSRRSRRQGFNGRYRSRPVTRSDHRRTAPRPFRSHDCVERAAGIPRSTALGANVASNVSSQPRERELTTHCRQMTFGNTLTAYAEQAAVGRVCLAIREPGQSRHPGSRDSVAKTVISNDNSGDCRIAVSDQEVTSETQRLRRSAKSPKAHLARRRLLPELDAWICRSWNSCAARATINLRFVRRRSGAGAIR
jgi:hypothetical protein